MFVFFCSLPHSSQFQCAKAQTYHIYFLFFTYTETFWTNPQYRLTVTDPDEDDDEELCTAIIALMQKGRRKKRKEGVDMLTIGYAVYRVRRLEKELEITIFPIVRLDLEAVRPRGQRRRANIETNLGERFLFAGTSRKCVMFSQY